VLARRRALGTPQPSVNSGCWRVLIGPVAEECGPSSLDPLEARPTTSSLEVELGGDSAGTGGRSRVLWWVSERRASRPPASALSTGVQISRNYATHRASGGMQLTSLARRRQGLPGVWGEDDQIRFGAAALCERRLEFGSVPSHHSGQAMPFVVPFVLQAIAFWHDAWREVCLPIRFSPSPTEFALSRARLCQCTPNQRFTSGIHQ